MSMKTPIAKRRTEKNARNVWVAQLREEPGFFHGILQALLRGLHGRPHGPHGVVRGGPPCRP
eukprot:8911111-Lingulodinium_polyedra.AAC.1